MPQPAIEAPRRTAREQMQGASGGGLCGALSGLLRPLCLPFTSPIHLTSYRLLNAAPRARFRPAALRQSQGRTAAGPPLHYRDLKVLSTRSVRPEAASGAVGLGSGGGGGGDGPRPAAMSGKGKANPKGVVNTFRRTWDKEEYREKAEEREKEVCAAAGPSLFVAFVQLCLWVRSPLGVQPCVTALRLCCPPCAGGQG